MKSTEFKKLIKDAVREAIQEELKEILLEAVKSPKITPNVGYGMTNESYIPPPPKQNITSSPSQNLMSPEQRRSIYEQMLGDTSKTLTTTDVQTFNPTPGADSINGSLPGGDVSMDQIMNLMTKK